jgi:hypothetical protein
LEAILNMRSQKIQAAGTLCYVLVVLLVAGAAADMGKQRQDRSAADRLILEQTDVPVAGYWASGSPASITRSDGVYVVAETYVHSDAYKTHGEADLHRYVDIKIEMYASEKDAREQYERVDRLFGSPILIDDREYLKVDIERGVGIAYYTLNREMCIGFVTNASESVLQQFVEAFWDRYNRLTSDPV